jgi:sulfoxide reductase heme-binding subunit YedZ
MNTALLIFLSVILACFGLAVAVVAAAPMLARKKATVSLVWTASILGVLGLAAAEMGGSTRLLDLTTVAGILLLGGVAGAGWAPPGGRVILVVGFLCLAAGFFARLEAFSSVVESGRGAALTFSPDSIAWGVARSAGFVAFLSATGAVLLGTRRPARLPVGGLPARVYALHRALGMAAVLALAVHLISLWLDSYVQFSWTQLLLLPWTSNYRPVAVTLGFLAMVSLLLTAASGGLRRLLPGWRVVHALAYLTFALGLIHGLLAGSDTGSPWAIAFYTAAFLAVGWTVIRRVSNSGPAPQRSPRRDFQEPISSLPDTTTKKRSRRQALR